MEIIIKTILPEQINGIMYILNHHYIELTDKAGNTTKLLAKGLLRGECTDCQQAFYVESKIGDLICPHCGKNNVKWAWGTVQVGFVPEQESAFLCTTFKKVP